MKTLFYEEAYGRYFKMDYDTFVVKVMDKLPMSYEDFCEAVGIYVPLQAKAFRKTILALKLKEDFQITLDGVEEFTRIEFTERWA